MVQDCNSNIWQMGAGMSSKLDWLYIARLSQKKEKRKREGGKAEEMPQWLRIRVQLQVLILGSSQLPVNHTQENPLFWPCGNYIPMCTPPIFKNK